MKVLFVVNPIAGKGKAIKTIPYINKTMREIGNVKYEIVNTKRPGHAIEIARSGSSLQYDIIFAVGGDGTVNEVVNGLMGSNTALAVIPGGSGNDFIRSLGVLGDTEKIIRDTIGGIRKYIDVGLINNRYFMNIASVGFDAEVTFASQKAKEKLFPGRLAYIVGFINTFLTMKSMNIKISIEDKQVEEEILLVAVANGKYYGGGMMAAPKADLKDGKFDICDIKSLSRVKMLFLFPKFIKGKHEKIKEVSFYRAEKVHIESKNPIAVNVDGEVTRDTIINFEIVKNGLIVAVPAGK